MLNRTKRILPFLMAPVAVILSACEDAPKTVVLKGPVATTSSAAPSAAPAAAALLASGTLELPAGIKGEGKMVFVSLRSVGGRGPPIAAVRLPAGPFPLKFEITEANVVAMGGQKRPVPAEFMLKATLDVDGNPMAKSPNDLQALQQTSKGTAGLKLTLGKIPPK